MAFLAAGFPGTHVSFPQQEGKWVVDSNHSIGLRGVGTEFGAKDERILDLGSEKFCPSRSKFSADHVACACCSTKYSCHFVSS